MASLAQRLDGIDTQLTELAQKYGVPGASLAVLHGDETLEAATGVTSTRTRVEVDTDTTFQIGSITKLFTSTLIMQLVEDGLVDLDVPLGTYLPELRLQDLDTLDRVTVRQLLTHTSGIDGDFFEDTGRGDDAIERYVVACSALGFLHPPGELFSYCNAGFVLAGRIVEKLRAQPFHTVFRERLLKPIGMRSSGTLPEEALLHRAAVGHFPNRDEGQPAFAAPVWMLVHSNAPAGSSPWAAARDLLAFGRMYMDGGEINGSRILSKATIDTMWEHQVETPDSFGGRPQGWGLGFMRFGWGGKGVVGHDGGTIGQSAFFRILPEEHLAVSLLTNGGLPGLLYRDLYNRIFGELAGIGLPEIPEADASLAIDAARYTGTYRKLSARVTVEAGEGNALVVSQEQRRLRLRPADNRPTVFRPVHDSTLSNPSSASPNAGTHFRAVEGPGSEIGQLVSFLQDDDGGRARYLHFGGRAHPRLITGA